MTEHEQRERRKMRPVSIKLPAPVVEMIEQLLAERPREYDGMSDVCRRVILDHPTFRAWLIAETTREKRDLVRKATF